MKRLVCAIFGHQVVRMFFYDNKGPRLACRRCGMEFER